MFPLGLVAQFRKKEAGFIIQNIEFLVVLPFIKFPEIRAAMMM